MKLIPNLAAIGFLLVAMLGHRGGKPIGDTILFVLIAIFWAIVSLQFAEDD